MQNLLTCQAGTSRVQLSESRAQFVSVIILNDDTVLLCRHRSQAAVTAGTSRAHDRLRKSLYIIMLKEGALFVRLTQPSVSFAT